MTKEQREYVSQHLRDLIAHDEHEGEDSDLPAFRAALPLLTDEAELQRSVGEAAIASLDGREPHQVENDASIVRDCMSTSGGGREVQKRVASTLEAIASALRGGGR